MKTSQATPDIKHNLTVNLADGAFFGLGLGVSSYTTILPLFIALLTDSATLVGLVAAMHMIGWQFPQLLTAGLVSRLRRYKPAVLILSTLERLPYFLLAILALSLGQMSTELALILIFPVVALLAFGGGFTATAWQSFVGKIFPAQIRGRFYGAQSSIANLFMSAGAIVAGLILGADPQAEAFALCFFISGIAMIISWAFLALSREADHEPLETVKRRPREFSEKIMIMLRQDSNLRWFILARMLAIFAQMAVGFYAIYGAQQLNADAPLLGAATGAMGLAQVLGAPIAGWLGDRYGHRRVFALGNILMICSAMIAIDCNDCHDAFPRFYPRWLQ